MISIAEAKQIREMLNLTHVVIFGITEDGSAHVSTHGKTQQHAREAAKAGNKLKAALGWPDELCHSEPLERIHSNCSYYKPDYGIHCFNGWSGDGSRGDCCIDPQKTRVVGDERACQYFEPK